MNSKEKTLATFQARVRQMILRFQQLEKENNELYGMVDKQEKDIAELKRRLEEKTHEYDSLKTARMIGISSGDIASAKDRLARLIRDVNKCITVLTEQKEG